ncbi:hypothetical protein KUV80_10060 [Fictibacillus nanhaiensis]|uniref:hypothetical protein n=1 Tax=Fictibacillus nanhaiensis TaxID=742169 RepID=UPI001C980810|nr:hypothetical protein [Fictibacillus nanhaiensis]MBY6037001.1 hypothetical protein [Fictibacillus nanhaiensis]
MEVLYSFVMGVLFLTIGFIAFFPPPKLHWIMRFSIVFIGMGFILYSFLRLFGLISY